MNIILAGFNGTWKKEAGVILSKRLNRKLFDVEQIIEEKEKDRIAHILQVKGSNYLKMIEDEIIEKISKYENCIILVGPDTISCEKNRQALKTNGVIIWFTGEPTIIFLRIHPGKTGRLLMKKKETLAYIRQLIKQKDYSHLADRIIDTTELIPEECADKVQQMLSTF